MQTMKRKIYTLMLVVIPIVAFVVNGQNNKIIATMNDVKIDETLADNNQIASVKEVNEENFSLSEQEIKNPINYPSNLFLVNRSNVLNESYISQSMKITNVEFVTYAEPSVRYMDSIAADALEYMFNVAKTNGITLLAVSGYRDYSYQQVLYNNEDPDNNKYVAPPGTSEHQTGLAVDILSNEYSNLDEGFDQTQTFKWLESNCYKYGFIIRYPRGKEAITGYNYEPWHIRYVGEIGRAHV